MEWNKFQVFGENEKNMVYSLKVLGIPKNASSVLVYLINKKEATSRDIEITAGLRQPEVSSAMQYLIARNWVSVEQKKGKGRGRPKNKYRLLVTIDEIIDYFSNQTEKEIDEIKEYKQKYYHFK